MESLGPAIRTNPAPVDLDAIKKQRLVQALESSNGNQSEAARILGLSRTSVWNQMKKYKIHSNVYKGGNQNQ